MSDIRRKLRALATLALATALAACSPVLNWRQVHMGGLSGQLPCKPDHASRDVPLGSQPVRLQMMGCEAGGALFAISHVQVADAVEAAKVLLDWQAQALRSLQAGTPHPVPAKNHAWAYNQVTIHASGKNPQGAAVNARLTWVVKGGNVYHLAVYGEQLTDAMTQPFFEDITSP